MEWWFIKQANERIAKIAAAEVAYADLEDRLSDADIVALEAAATPSFMDFYATMSSAVAAGLASHPMGPAIMAATAEALAGRVVTSRPARRRAARLFRHDAERLARFEAVTGGLRLAMVHFNLMPVLHATETAMPWRLALGDKYDIGRLGIVVDMDNGHWRRSGSACPTDNRPIDMDRCSPCPFFRGAVSAAAKDWKMNCNWPRVGSTIAAPRPSISTGDYRIAVPPIFRTAFESD
jgi:hypothetical protein